MSRLDYLTIGIVALCIAALIYLVYRYVNLPHSATNTTTTEVVKTDNTQVQKEDTSGFPAEDTSENNQPGPGAGIEPEPEVIPEEKTPVLRNAEKPAVTEIKPVTPPVNNTASETASLSAGRYMVLIGSFEQMSQAQTQLQMVKKLGYVNARIAKFNRGKYASVLVDHFGQASEAKSLAKTLTKKGFDAGVMVKR
ncbi:MAG: SPOR domain-containing protein [Haliscomenobacter sp.]|uniref:SPOR domain-containing protein n=1 Tax=Haliscomenobacter sp. TaxID=2717303 RepID=UPI0029A0F49F|nr:SPOR domain-containing protein [Haliscomenobacter sp.]MDX2068337.1 SPOR domain-containing protein [Haliscomenobacter sp.]